jgi:hypothetical protein
MIALGLVVAIPTAIVFAIAVRATRLAMWGHRGPAWLPGVTPEDLADVETTMARTAHLYRGFGHNKTMRGAVRKLERTARRSPRVWSMATLECGTLGRSTWFRLDDGTAARLDDAVAVALQDPDTATHQPELLLEHAELIGARRHPSEVILQFREAGSLIELRASGAAIL